MRRALTAFLLLFASHASHAGLTIEITGGATLQMPIAIAPFQGEQAYGDKLSEIIAADLARSGQFKIVDTRGLPIPRTPQETRLNDWKASGAVALTIGSITPQAGGRIEVQFRLLDTVRDLPR